MSPFENISVDFVVKSSWADPGGGWGQKLWIGVDDAFLARAPECMLLALLGVSLARESPSCCDGPRGIKDFQHQAAVTDLRERFCGGEQPYETRL
jgi:hypothetical protein